MTDPLLDGLNPQQREAVTLPDQNALVLAGAGSGKTRVLTSRIAWLIREGRARPSGILAVTFTNKASREMLSRIESQMKVETRGMWVGTFHGLCNRMLRVHYSEAGLPQGFQIVDQADQLSLVKRVMKGAGIDKETVEPKAVQAFINGCKEEGRRSADVRSTDAHAPNAAVSLQLYRLYERLCADEGVVDFAELLLRCYELLQRNELIRRHYERKFSHILVDEFQDTNVLQYRWLKTLAGYGLGSAREPGVTNSIFAVGDDDQSIYAFRGANVGNMRDFERELGVGHVVRLEQNYRSSGHILDAANALISNNTGRLGKNLWTDAGAGERLHVMPTESGEAEARFVADEVMSGHMRGAKYSDYAVLYRSNAQSRALESVMMASGIPYRIYGGHRFFERAHVKDALAYLRLVENPDDNTAFLRAVNMPPRGIGAKTVEAIGAKAEEAGISFMKAAALSPASKPGQFAELISSLRSAADGLGLVDTVKEVLRRSTLLEYCKAVDRKEHSSKAEDLGEMANAAAAFLQNSEIEPRSLALAPVSDDELSPLASFLALATLEAGDNQAGEGEDSVQMMTVHAAKGLEFPTVFITGLEENLFPHAGAVNEDGEKGLEEERRLMYVAITRAKRRLFLTFAARRVINGQFQDQQQSSFIDEIPGEHLEWMRSRESVERSSWDSSSGSWGRGGARGRGSASYGSYETWGRRPNRDGGNGESASGAGGSWKPRSKDEPYRGSKEEPLLRRRKAGADGWQAGQHVRHPKFGKGVVVSVIGSGEETKLAIAFAGLGVKQLLAKIAKLEKI
ncbi:MAG: UvrD-helicase domain-containing protein [Sutterellaceae bacterium]|nr:UvrD-helicase domain-containing protein [Sutterellaceae bacterium]